MQVAILEDCGKKIVFELASGTIKYCSEPSIYIVAKVIAGRFICLYMLLYGVLILFRISPPFLFYFVLI